MEIKLGVLRQQAETGPGLEMIIVVISVGRWCYFCSDCIEPIKNFRELCSLGHMYRFTFVDCSKFSFHYPHRQSSSIYHQLAILHTRFFISMDMHLCKLK